MKPYTVAANSRFNIWVDYEDARLADTAVSTTIRSTNGVPVIVERAMWWPGTAAWHEAHNSAGATTTGTRWAVADGQVDTARNLETYILIANTSATPADVKVTLLFEDGDERGADLRRHPGAEPLQRARGRVLPPGRRTVRGHRGEPGHDAGADRRRAGDVLGRRGPALGGGHERAGDQVAIAGAAEGDLRRRGDFHVECIGRPTVAAEFPFASLRSYPTQLQSS